MAVAVNGWLLCCSKKAMFLKKNNLFIYPFILYYIFNFSFIKIHILFIYYSLFVFLFRLSDYTINCMKISYELILLQIFNILLRIIFLYYFYYTYLIYLRVYLYIGANN